MIRARCRRVAEKCDLANNVNFPIISGLNASALRKEGDLEKAIIISKENGAKGISIFTADGLNKEQQSVFVKLKNIL